MKRIGRIITWLLIILLFVSGLLLIFHQQVETYLVSNDTKQVLQQPMKRENAQSMGKKPTYNYDEIKSVGFADVVKAQRHRNKNVDYIGKIAIPSVHILLPIIEGVTNQSMSVGAGTMKPGQQMGKGNYALASHNMNDYKTLFSPLLNIQKGAKIYLTNGTETFIYKVNRKEYINPNQVDVIDDEQGKTEITLITCSMDGKQRLLVQGNLVDQTKGEASVFQ